MLFAGCLAASFLTDRTQCVISPSGKSGNLAITRSIVQGSGNEPTAFLAMILDLQPVHQTTTFLNLLMILNYLTRFFSIEWGC
jgi:hypothetical protein